MRAIHRLPGKVLIAKEYAAPGLYGDGGGLWLQITPAGTKSWVFRWDQGTKVTSSGKVIGRRRHMGLGATHTVTLAEARAKATECRKLVLEGIDPIKHRDARISAERADHEMQKTFKECAEAYIKVHAEGWSNQKHTAQWENTLTTYAYPKIGKLFVRDIQMAHVLKVLEPIWSTKTVTASRLRGRVESVLDWAKGRGYRAGDNPAAWKGNLDAQLVEPNKIAETGHHPSLEYAHMYGFVQALRNIAGVSAMALEFLILTACRTEEVIGARWEEFDLDGRIWTIPKERMKGKREHTVPLSDRALEILRIVDALGGEYVFPGRKKARPLSNMAMLEMTRRLGWKNKKGEQIVVHGFRSTFRVWAAELTNYPREVAEHALAHKLPDKVEASYQRSTIFVKRVHLMNDWAKFCACPAVIGGSVVPMKVGVAA